MRFIYLVVSLELLQRSQVAHPNGILRRQIRSEQIRFTRLHIDGTVEVRLAYAERPVKVGLLAKDRLVIRWKCSKVNDFV